MTEQLLTTSRASSSEQTPPAETSIDDEIKKLEASLRGHGSHVTIETHNPSHTDTLLSELSKLEHPDMVDDESNVEYLDPEGTTTAHEFAMNGGYTYGTEAPKEPKTTDEVEKNVADLVKEIVDDSKEPLSRVEKREIFKQRIAKFGRTALMTTLITANAVPVILGAYTGDTSFFADNIYDAVTGADVAPVPASIIDQVNELAGTATDPELLEIMDLYDGKEFEEHYFDYVQEKAAENGLHLSDASEYIEKLQGAETFGELVDTLNEYGSTLGLDFVEHSTLDIQDTGLGVVPLNETNHPVTPELIDKFEAVMGALQYVPIELLEFADVKEVRLVDSLNVMGFDAAAEAAVWTGNMYLEVGTMNNGGYELLMHELSHFIDYRMSGSSLVAESHDTPYNDLNNGEINYTEVYGTASDETSGVAEEYGTTNVFEDKATMMETMINGLDQKLLQSKDPIVQEKYRLLLARLDQNVPGMLGYLMAISLHN